MSGGQGSKWGTLKNVYTVLRSSRDDQDEGQARGWERRRDDVPPSTNPPSQPNRPAYGYSQHYPSDPGPHNGYPPLLTSPPPPPQGSPPLHQNQNYQDQYQRQHQGQYQGGLRPQGYNTAPPPNMYTSTYPQAYGQNHSYFSPPPPASQPQNYQSYQQQPTSSYGQGYQGGQGAYPNFYNQPTYQPASNSSSPPLPHHSDSQYTEGPSQSPTFAGPLYPTQTNDGSLSPIGTAPPDLHCGHRYPGDPLCRDCQRRYGSRIGR